MKHLRGIAWDHIRGYAPLVEASKQFMEMHPDVSVIWDKRSLEDFESYPIEILAQKYDLLTIDHPFVGTGVNGKIIEALDSWVPEEFLLGQKAHSVGPSYQSYTWEGHQWALPLDAAAQVSAYRLDLLSSLNLSVPKTWDDVLDLTRALPNDLKVGIPLSPTHAYSTFVTVCAHLAEEEFWDQNGIDVEVAGEALYFIRKILPELHPDSLASNPIQMSETMSKVNEIVYVPFVFGYSNYARPGFAPFVLHFGDIPTIGSRPPKGSILGGVGIAMSAYSEEKTVASEFIQYVTSEPFQVGAYFEVGGQPGHLKAWTSELNNSKSNHFFKNTQQTLELSYIRPRNQGYPSFQIEAGEVIHSFLRSGEDRAATVKELNRLYKELTQFA
ncbi:extracellular solute-binding protein [Alicyclobacillus tolerans]|uniref:ABC transporter substrate-binding protein n=1 Tax=Alicyclobacillus tolerans TaxID=90970 RepID=UPI001F2F9451|nr:extracellular solute-binding protein [Alicyclobacillus tolerans]MCF8567954.1 extracellular solute-binding protein [Alicyclobacillus tolerans]